MTAIVGDCDLYYVPCHLESLALWSTTMFESKGFCTQPLIVNSVFACGGDRVFVTPQELAWEHVPHG